MFVYYKQNRAIGTSNQRDYFLLVISENCASDRKGQQIVRFAGYEPSSESKGSNGEREG